MCPAFKSAAAANVGAVLTLGFWDALTLMASLAQGWSLKAPQARAKASISSKIERVPPMALRDPNPQWRTVVSFCHGVIGDYRGFAGAGKRLE